MKRIHRNEMNFCLISLPVAALNCGRMISLVQGDVYIWVWFSFVEIGLSIFVSSYISLSANCGAPFFPEVRFTRSLIFKLQPKRGFERFHSQKRWCNIIPNNSFFFRKRASYASKLVLALQPQSQTCS